MHTKYKTPIIHSSQKKNNNKYIIIHSLYTEATFNGFPIESQLDVHDMILLSGATLFLNAKLWNDTIRENIELPSAIPFSDERSLFNVTHQRLAQLVVLRRWAEEFQFIEDLLALILTYLRDDPVTRVRTSDYARDSTVVYLRKIVDTSKVHTFLNEAIGLFQLPENRQIVYVDNNYWDIVELQNVTPLMPATFSEYSGINEAIIPFITIGKIAKHDEDYSPGQEFQIFAGICSTIHSNKNPNALYHNYIHLIMNHDYASFRTASHNTNPFALTVKADTRNDAPVLFQTSGTEYIHICKLRSTENSTPIKLHHLAEGGPYFTGFELQLYPAMGSAGDPYDYPISDWAANERFTPNDDNWSYTAVCGESECKLNHLSGPPGCCITNHISHEMARTAWNQFSLIMNANLSRDEARFVAALAYDRSKRDVATARDWFNAARQWVGINYPPFNAQRVFRQFMSPHLHIRLTDAQTTMQQLKLYLVYANRILNTRIMTNAKSSTQKPRQSQATTTTTQIPLPPDDLKSDDDDPTPPPSPPNGPGHFTPETTPSSEERYLGVDHPLRIAAENAQASPTPPSDNESSSSSDELLFPSYASTFVNISEEKLTNNPSNDNTNDINTIKSQPTSPRISPMNDNQNPGNNSMNVPHLNLNDNNAPSSNSPPIYQTRDIDLRQFNNPRLQRLHRKTIRRNMRSILGKNNTSTNSNDATIATTTNDTSTPTQSESQLKRTRSQSSSPNKERKKRRRRRSPPPSQS